MDGEAAVTALRNKGCTLKVDEGGRAWYLYASDMLFTSDDAQYVGELTALRELVLFDCVHDDSIWSVLDRLPSLERLKLVGRNPREPIGSDKLIFDPRPLPWLGVSDHGSQFLRSVPKLISLELTCTEVGDATLEQVGYLALLEKLVLNGTRISGAGMQSLSGLTRLDSLSVPYTKVDDRGVECVEMLTTLTTLELEGTKVTNLAIPHLRKLAALKVLSLHNTDVTEEGLSQLSQLECLETLYVGGPITAVGARFLKDLPSLRWLYVGCSNKGRDMTHAEYEWLRAELPNVGFE